MKKKTILANAETPLAPTQKDARGQMEPTPRPWFLTPRDTPNETRENFIQSLCIESDAGFVMRVSDLGHAKTEPQRRVDAEFILRAVNSFDDLLEALKYARRMMKSDSDHLFVATAISKAEDREVPSDPNLNLSASRE